MKSLISNGFTGVISNSIGIIGNDDQFLELRLKILVHLSVSPIFRFKLE